MVIDLLLNFSVMASLLFISGKLFENIYIDENSPLKVRLFVGFISGLIGILLMYSTIDITDRVIVDLRHLALIIAAVFGGPVSVIVSGIIIGFMRVILFGVTLASIVAGSIVFVMGILLAIISKAKINNTIKYVIMNVISTLISSFVILILINNRNISIPTLIFYLPIAVIGGIFTYYMTEYIKNSNDNHRSKLYYKLITENSTDLISTHDSKGTFIYLTPSCESILGYRAEELIGLNPYDYYHPDDINVIKKSHNTVMNTNESYRVEYRFKKKNGDYVWVETTSKEMSGIKKEKELICISRDITKRKKLEEELYRTHERYKFIMDHSREVMSILDNQGTIQYISPACKEVFGYKSDYLINENMFENIHPDDVVEFQKLNLNSQTDVTLVYRYLRGNQLHKWIETDLKAISKNGKLENILAISRDVTERIEKEQTLENTNKMLHKLSLLDGLTEIPNRRYFNEKLIEEWDAAREQSTPLSIIIIDIDYFKKYNDAYGHLQGDECLINVAKTIQICINDGNAVVARYGGEEFVVILSKISEERVAQIAEQLRIKIREQKIEHRDSDIDDYVTISLGCATLIPNSNNTIEDLINFADQALYKAKLTRNSVSQYKK